jgi:hypothetical protein
MYFDDQISQGLVPGKDEQERRINVAAEFVKSALQLKEPRITFGTQKQNLLLNALESSFYKVFIQVVVLVLCLLVVVEEPSYILGMNQEEKVSRKIAAIELCLNLVLALDIGLRIYAEGWRRFFSKKWNILYAVLVSCSVLSCTTRLLGAPVVIFIFSRTLRQLLLLCKSSRIRRAAARILVTFPKIIKVFLLCGVVFLCFGAIIHFTFGGLVNVEDQDLQEYKYQNFESIATSFIAACILSSTENYPDIMVRNNKALSLTLRLVQSIREKTSSGSLNLSFLSDPWIMVSLQLGSSRHFPIIRRAND